MDSDSRHLVDARGYEAGKGLTFSSCPTLSPSTSMGMEVVRRSSEVKQLINQKILEKRAPQESTEKSEVTSGSIASKGQKEGFWIWLLRKIGFLRPEKKNPFPTALPKFLIVHGRKSLNANTEEATLAREWQALEDKMTSSREQTEIIRILRIIAETNLNLIHDVLRLNGSDGKRSIAARKDAVAAYTDRVFFLGDCYKAFVSLVKEEEAGLANSRWLKNLESRIVEQIKAGIEDVAKLFVDLGRRYEFVAKRDGSDKSAAEACNKKNEACNMRRYGMSFGFQLAEAGNESWKKYAKNSKGILSSKLNRRHRLPK